MLGIEWPWNYQKAKYTWSFSARKRAQSAKNAKKEAYERGSSRLPPTLALKRRVGAQLRDQGITPFGQRRERLCWSTDTVYGLSLHREVYFADVSRWVFD